MTPRFCALLLAAWAWAALAQAKDCATDYEEGRYAEAGACFEVRAAERPNGHLHYNAGNAWYRAGDVGRAVLAYRRAALFLPRHGDVLANLKSARDMARDDLEPPGPTGPLAGIVWGPYEAFAQRELLLLGALAWALFFGLATARSLGSRRASAPALAVAGLLALWALGGWAMREQQLQQRPDAVVLDEQVTLRSGRDVQSVDLAELHAGAEVAVAERRGGWAQIALPSGQRGWLPEDGLGFVSR